MVIFNRSYEVFPLPVWQKVKRGNEFIMQYVNPTYLDYVGNQENDDIYDFIGKNNFELFPKHIAQIYYENDVAVSITGNKLETTEKFTENDGTTVKLKILKWREIKENKDTLIYGMIKEIIKQFYTPKYKVEEAVLKILEFVISTIMEKSYVLNFNILYFSTSFKMTTKLAFQTASLFFNK